MRKSKKDRLWVQWDRRLVQELACRPWMTLACWRVLACLVAQLQIDGRTQATQQSMQESLGVTQQQISRAVQVLKREGVVYQERRGGAYFLAIDYVYCGDGAHRAYWGHQEARRRRGKRGTHGGKGTQAEEPRSGVGVG